MSSSAANPKIEFDEDPDQGDMCLCVRQRVGVSRISFAHTSTSVNIRRSAGTVPDFDNFYEPCHLVGSYLIHRRMVFASDPLRVYVHKGSPAAEGECSPRKA